MEIMQFIHDRKGEEFEENNLPPQPYEYHINLDIVTFLEYLDSLFHVFGWEFYYRSSATHG